MNKYFLTLFIIFSRLSLNCVCLSLRDLYDDSKRQDICKKAGNYKDPKEMSSLSSFVETLGEGSEAGKKFIEGMLTTGRFNDLPDFLKELAGYLVLMAFGGAFLICKFYI